MLLPLTFISFVFSLLQWDLLLRDYNEAKEYIEDIKDTCDDFEGLCQRNLAANTGKVLDVGGFLNSEHLNALYQTHLDFTLKEYDLINK